MAYYSKMTIAIEINRNLSKDPICFLNTVSKNYKTITLKKLFIKLI